MQCTAGRGNPGNQRKHCEEEGECTEQSGLSAAGELFDCARVQRAPSPYQQRQEDRQQNACGKGTIRDGEDERRLSTYRDEERAHGTEVRYGQAIQTRQVAGVPVWKFSLIGFPGNGEESPKTECGSDCGKGENQEQPRRLPAIEQDDAGEEYPANRD